MFSRTYARMLAVQTFYRLPRRFRQRLVRLGAPTYTVGAVTIVRDPTGTRILLLRQPPGRGWSLPGGLLARREEPVAAAARELGEETGIDLRPDELRPAVPNAVVHHRGGWVDTVFTASVPTDVQLTVDPAEVLEARWFDLTDLPRLTEPTARLLGRYGIGPYA